MNSCPSRKNQRNNRTLRRIALDAGFSLVELMIAITIGLFITAGLTAVFVSNSRTQGEIERANRQIENGRYAMHMLTEDLRLAGFYGEFDPTILATPAAVPDPCLTLPADLKDAMPLHVQGYDGDIAGPSLGCLGDVRSGTDILVVRRVNTCFVGSAECDAVAAGAPYFQASLCNGATELASGDSTKFYALDTDTDNLTRTKRDCATLADFRRYRTHIYFIANNGSADDGIPTLKRAELGASGGVTSFSIVPLVEGIENLQLEYGVDADNNGSPETYTTLPATVEDWRGVVGVRLNLLARSTDRSPGYTDSKTYNLGLKADGTANTVGPFEDSVKRHAYQTFVKLGNPAGRRE